MFYFFVEHIFRAVVFVYAQTVYIIFIYRGPERVNLYQPGSSKNRSSNIRLNDWSVAGASLFFSDVNVKWLSVVTVYHCICIQALFSTGTMFTCLRNMEAHITFSSIIHLPPFIQTVLVLNYLLLSKF